MIAVANGVARKIEDFHIGDKVTNPYASGLTVVDTVIGTERTPMVRITDTRNRTLLMTEMHPLHVVDRGMVPAKMLKVGDRVKTDDGSSELVSVTREAYTGKVFNLKVGNSEEAKSLGVDQTVMYANGFLVGDVQIQTKYHFMELANTGAAAHREKRPLKWQKDYMASLSRNAHP